MSDITYKLDLFEGPLDLLLTLISKNKINIDDIPISLLCDQYMEYINAANKMDMELSSEFIIMASELMLIKSRMLLPWNKEEDEDPRAALAKAVMEYQRAKKASVILSEAYSRYGLRMVKDTDEITIDKTYIADHDVELLAKAYNKILSENKFSESDSESKLDIIINSTPISIISIANKLTSALVKSKKMQISECFKLVYEKSELIVMFISVLELLKSGFIIIEDNTISENSVINTLKDDICILLKDGVEINDINSILSDER